MFKAPGIKHNFIETVRIAKTLANPKCQRLLQNLWIRICWMHFLDWGGEGRGGNGRGEEGRGGEGGREGGYKDINT